jgi:Arc/MetJ-type ribon-helix-helix transcriptional regulator
LLHDIDNLHEQHRAYITSWFTDPTSYSEDTYYAQKEKFDKLFQFSVQHQDNPKLVDRLQETMQALKLCKDTMKSFVKVNDLADEATNVYLGELHAQIDLIMVLIQKGEYKNASNAIDILASRDEKKMQELTHSGKPVSESIVELIQIHDHIHGSLRSLVEGKI